MIRMLGEYVLSLTAGTILCAVLLSLFPQGTVRSLVNLCCGAVLTVMALSPLPGVELPDLTVFARDYAAEGQLAALQGAAQAEENRLQCIKDGLDAYILDKADSLGAMVQPEVRLDENGTPGAVTITGSWTSDQRSALAAIITNDLGIPEEDQQWNARNGPSESENGWENTAGQP